MSPGPALPCPGAQRGVSQQWGWLNGGDLNRRPLGPKGKCLPVGLRLPLLPLPRLPLPLLSGGCICEAHTCPAHDPPLGFAARSPARKGQRLLILTTRLNCAGPPHPVPALSSFSPTGLPRPRTHGPSAPTVQEVLPGPCSVVQPATNVWSWTHLSGLARVSLSLLLAPPWH